MRQEENRLLKALYEEYLVPLKKLAAKMGIHYDDIEDMVHETILSYYDRYPLDWSDKQKRVMLARILRSKWIDNYRKNSHFSDVSMDDFEDALFVLKRLLDRDALSYVIDNEVYREVRSLVDGMKKDWRDVITLYVLEDRPIKEVCEILGISGTVCRSRISRAKKYLREKLKEADWTEY